MNLERGIGLARKLLTRYETPREAIGRAFIDPEAKDELNEIIGREYIEPDDMPGSGIRQKRVFRSPFKRRFVETQGVEIFNHEKEPER